MVRWAAALGLVLGCVGEPLPGDTSDTGPSDADADTDADTDADADSDTDTDTATPPAEPSPFAGCTAVRTDDLGAVTTYTHDSDGRLDAWVYDQQGDGTPEDTATYSWTVVGGRVTGLAWSTASGTSGTASYDDWEHIVEATTTSSVGTYTTVYTNTLDAAHRLTRSVAETLGTPAVTTTDYDGCEHWTRQEIDVHGDASLLVVSTAAWTADADCTPSEVVVTSDTSASTTTYDAEGRTLTEEGVTASTTYSAAWAWSCP